MSADSMLPGGVTDALEEYGRLLEEHGITWGEPEIPYVKFFARRRVLRPELFDRFWELVFKAVAETHPEEPRERLVARLAEPDYDRVLRDTLDGELPAHLHAIRIEEDGAVLEGAARTILLPSPELCPLAADEDGTLVTTTASMLGDIDDELRESYTTGGVELLQALKAHAESKVG